MKLSRRRLLSTGLAVAVSGVATRAEAAPVVVPLGPSSALLPGTSRSFAYPDKASPALLLRLRGPTPGGVGPGQDIVAYSALCTHQGCPVVVKADRLVCPCHGSHFDPGCGGQCFQGSATTALPRIRLTVSAAGELAAVGVDGVIWGRINDAVMA